MSHISPVNLIDQVRSYITHCALLGIDTVQAEVFLSQRYGIPPTWTHTVWEMMYQDSLKFFRDNYDAVVAAQQNPPLHQFLEARSHRYHPYTGRQQPPPVYPHMVHGYHYQPLVPHEYPPPVHPHTAHGYHHQPPPVYPHMDNGYHHQPIMGHEYQEQPPPVDPYHHQPPMHPLMAHEHHELQPPPLYPHMVHGYHYQPPMQPHEYQEQPPHMGHGYHHDQPPMHPLMAHEYHHQPPVQPHMTYQQRIHAWLLDINGDPAFPQNDSNVYNEQHSPSTASSITFPSAASSSSIATNDNALLK